MRWFHIAAEGNYPDAVNAIGAFHARGRGVAPDRAEAIAWYLKAARLGNEQAKENLRHFGITPPQ